MAKMIPAECDLSVRPFSEQTVFNALQTNLSNDWTVFHAFEFVDRNAENQRWEGEIDFLIYNPRYGMLVLEVKGGAISYRCGTWYQEDRVIKPVHQARKNKYAVRHILQETSGLKELPLKIAHAVCFPSLNSQSVWPPEAQGLVITGNQLPFIERHIIRILDETPMPNAGGVLLPDEIIMILSPYFDYKVRLLDRMNMDDKKIFQLTEEQCALLATLENFSRLKICGCAGSGKTLMAIKRARELAADGNRVLLLCYNVMLAKYLQKETQDSSLITADAFFEYCIKTVNLSEEQVKMFCNDPRLYSNALPTLLAENIRRKCIYYDAVIVDEGQDFTKEAWEVISLLPEQSRGSFYIFYDPDQNIFTPELNLPDFGVPPVILRRNCRNTRKICEALKPYQTTQGKVREDAPDGVDVVVRTGDCRAMLLEELDKLTLTDRISLSNIVILGAHNMENSSIGDDSSLGRYYIVNRPAVTEIPEVAYYTYMKFKGCESKVVILLDVDEKDPRWNKKGMYTAMSRAVHKLIILKKAPEMA